MSAGGRREPDAGPSASVRRRVAINVLVFILLCAATELGARLVAYITTGDSAASIAERTQYLSYRPFVMFGPDWDAALRPAPASPGATSGRPFRILVLGASVAAAFPPDALARAFSDRLPGRDVHVIMAASGGYVARQELVVASLWGPALNPDLIVTFDGSNDLDVRLRVGSPGTFALDGAYALMLTKPFLAPMAYLLSHSQAYNGVSRLAARYRVGGVGAYEDAIPVYISAQHSINVLARGLSARRLMVLEPFVAFKEPQSQAERSMTRFKYREPVMKELYGRTHGQLAALARSDHAAYLDARFLFDGIASTIFRDDVHFADARAYQLLATAMAGCLRGEVMDETSCQAFPAGRDR